MFELADSGSSGDLPLLCSPLLLSPALFPPVSLSFFHLSTCYATLCHAALAQVCSHVLILESTHHLRRLHLRPFSSSSLNVHTLLSPPISSTAPFHAPSFLSFRSTPFLSFSSTPPTSLCSFLFLPRQPRLARSYILSHSRNEQSDRVGGESSLRSSSLRRLGEPTYTFARTPVQEHIVTPSGASVRTRCTGRRAAPDHRYSFIYSPGPLARQVTRDPFLRLSISDTTKMRWDRPMTVDGARLSFHDRREEGVTRRNEG